jgi:hypothetical protein
MEKRGRTDDDDAEEQKKARLAKANEQQQAWRLKYYDPESNYNKKKQRLRKARIQKARYRQQAWTALRTKIAKAMDYSFRIREEAHTPIWQWNIQAMMHKYKIPHKYQRLMKGFWSELAEQWATDYEGSNKKWTYL